MILYKRHQRNSFQTSIIWVIVLLGLMLSSCNLFESTQAKLQKGEKLYKDNKFNQSIILTKGILQKDPKNCKARILLGKSQFAKFSLLDAQDSLGKAKDLGCQDPQIFYFMVKMSLYRGDFSGAKALFSDHGFSYAVKEPESQILEGDLYFLQKKYNKAKSAYAKYFGMTHDAAAECLSQAKLLAVKNDYDAVIQKTRGCEKKFVNQPKYNLEQSRYIRAIAQVNQKQVGDATATLKLLLAQYSDLKDPNIKIQSSVLLMNLYLSQKDIKDAAKMANELLKYIATPNIYYARGLKYEIDNRYDLAEQQFLEALKLNPNHKFSLLELANIKFKEGNVGQAKYYAGKADSLTGKSVFTERLNELLAVKYLKTGDLDSIINKLPHDKTGGTVRSQYILALAYAKKGDRAKALDVFQGVKRRLPDNNVNRELLEARLYVALQDFKKAENIFQKYATKGNAYAVAGLSQVYIREHQYEKAEQLLVDASKESKNKYNSTLLLVELYSVANQKQKLFQLLNKSIKAEPGNENYQLVLAKAYYKYAMYQKAINQCDTIIQAKPQYPQAYIIKANSYIQLGKTENAVTTYTDLLRRDRKNTYAYLMLAYLAGKESKYDAAIEYIDKALEINPRYLAAVYAKIDFLVAQKKNDDALSFAKSSSGIFKQKQIQEILLAFAYKKIGNDKSAYIHYKAALGHGNQDIRVAWQMYKLTMNLDGADAAENELDEFLQKYSGINNIFYVANNFMNDQNYRLAEKYYELFIKQNQKNPIVYNNLAWLKLHRGDNAAALDAANKALRLAPNSAAIMDTMGQVLLKTGDYDKAGSYLLSAHQKLMDNPSVKYHLAQYYYYTKEYHKSRALLREIVKTQFSEQSDARRLLNRMSQ